MRNFIAYYRVIVLTRDVGVLGYLVIAFGYVLFGLMILIQTTSGILVTEWIPLLRCTNRRSSLPERRDCCVD